MMSSAVRRLRGYVLASSAIILISPANAQSNSQELLPPVRVEAPQQKRTTTATMVVPVSRRSGLIKTSLGALSLMLILLTGDVARAADAEVDIARLLRGMFDKPGAALEVAPVVVAGDFAIAGWTQGEMGGRALLRRKDEAWVITLCAGDGIKSHEALRQAGVPEQEATSLAHDLAVAESKIDGQRVAMFSRFEGMVTMDGAAAPTRGDAHRTK